MRTYQDWLRRYGFALLTLAVTAEVMAIPDIEDRAGPRSSCTSSPSCSRPGTAASGRGCSPPP